LAHMPLGTYTEDGSIPSLLSVYIDTLSSKSNNSLESATGVQPGACRTLACWARQACMGLH